jgi:O-antigen/teichoic acid export membrane protein
VVRKTLGFGLRGYVGNLLQHFNYRIDLFFVSAFLGANGVGIYSVAVGLAEVLWHLPGAVAFVIFPRTAGSSIEKSRRDLGPALWLTLGATAMGAALIALVGRPAIRLLFSEAFLDAYVPLLLLLPGVVLLGGAKVLAGVIGGRGFPHLNSINSGISLAVTVVLDLILIPRYGVAGASIASTAAYATTFVTALAMWGLVGRDRSEKGSGGRDGGGGDAPDAP